ncbi:MAG: hypothetical protein ABJB12_18180, partial [Pseudomonadota bacterium]
MNQYAGTLIVCVCLGAVAAIGAGCDSGSSDNGGAAGSTTTSAAGSTTTSAAGSTTTSAAGSTTTGAAGSTTTGTAGAGTGTGGAAAGVLPVDATGFVSAPALGI